MTPFLLSVDFRNFRSFLLQVYFDTLIIVEFELKKSRSEERRVG